MGQNHDLRRGDTSAGTRLMLGSMSVLTAVGLSVLALAHVGIDILGLSDLLGIPAVPPIAILYAILAIAFGVSAYGIFAQTSWAWKMATAVYLVALLMTAVRWAQVSAHGVPAINFVVPSTLLLAAVMVFLSPGRRRSS